MISESVSYIAICDAPGCPARVELAPRDAARAPAGWGYARAMSRSLEDLDCRDVHLLCPACSGGIPLFLREGVVAR